VNKLKTLLVDDERLARNKLRSMLASYPQIQIVGEADSVASAVELIENARPDVIFLDIQMPGETGFALLEKVEADFKTIFVTAFDEHAIRAFEVNALDYLLKPVNPARLARSIERLVASTVEHENARRALEYDDHIFLSIDRRTRFIKVNAIKCIVAEGPYSRVFTSDGAQSMVLRSLKEWEDRLPEKHFLRIHRSTIINLECVSKIEKWLNYSYQVFVDGIEQPFVMSRRYAARLKDRMG
jgi:two-component system LytT family response regulator